MKKKIARGHLVGQSKSDAVEPSLSESGEIQRCLAQSLGGKSPGVGSSSTQGGGLFHQGNLLAEVSGLGRTLLARGPRADHHQVIFDVAHPTHGLSDRRVFDIL